MVQGELRESRLRRGARRLVYKLAAKHGGHYAPGGANESIFYAPENGASLQLQILFKDGYRAQSFHSELFASFQEAGMSQLVLDEKCNATFTLSTNVSFPDFHPELILEADYFKHRTEENDTGVVDAVDLPPEDLSVITFAGNSDAELQMLEESMM